MCSLSNLRASSRYLPESARWLLAKGRKEEAQKELLRAARVNGRKVPDNFMEKVQQICFFRASKSRLDLAFRHFSPPFFADRSGSHGQERKHT